MSAPVAVYLRHVLRDGWRPVVVARLSQVGELRTDMKKDRWSRFEATQIVVPPVNGFVWDARVRIVPLLHVRVRDAYVGGQGSGRVSFLSALTVASDSGGHPWEGHFRSLVRMAEMILGGRSFGQID